MAARALAPTCEQCGDVVELDVNFGPDGASLAARCRGCGLRDWIVRRETYDHRQDFSTARERRDRGINDDIERAQGAALGAIQWADSLRKAALPIAIAATFVIVGGVMIHQGRIMIGLALIGIVVLTLLVATGVLWLRGDLQ